MFNILAANYKDYIIAAMLLTIIMMGIYTFTLKNINNSQSIIIAEQASQIDQLVLIAKQNQDVINQLKSINDKITEDFYKYRESIKNQNTMTTNVDKIDNSLKNILNDNLITIDTPVVNTANDNKANTVTETKRSPNVKQPIISSSDLAKPHESLVNFTNKINSLLTQ